MPTSTPSSAADQPTRHIRQDQEPHSCSLDRKIGIAFDPLLARSFMNPSIIGFGYHVIYA